MQFLNQIYLVPPSLARKRVWNKKYPICIELGKQDDFMSKAEADKGDAGEERATPAEKEACGTGEDAKRPPATQDGVRASGQKEQTLYLFGRTGREKEEWFRRMLVASRLKSEARKPTSLPASKSGKYAGRPLCWPSAAQAWCLDLGSWRGGGEFKVLHRPSPLLDFTVFFLSGKTCLTGLARLLKK